MNELFLKELEAIGVLGKNSVQPVQEAPPCSPEYWLERPPQDLFGLALSGGGIRSATFSLGLLQGFSELGLLGDFHYLSTVSGGGYAGGFWTRWRSRNASGDFPRPEHVEARAIRHLREFSNFLSPRLGIFNLETGNIASVLVASIVPSLLAALSVILLVLYLWAACAWLVFAHSPAISLATVAGVILGLQVFFEGIWWRCSKPKEKALGTYIVSVFLALAAAGLTWWLVFIEPIRVPGWAWIPSPLPWGGWIALDLSGGRGFSTFLALFAYPLGYRLFAPAAAAAAAGLALVLLRWVGSRWWTSFRSRGRRAAIDRALSRVLLAVAAWLVIGLLWDLGAALISDQRGWGGLSIFGLAGVSGALFSWARKLLGEQPNKPQVGGFIERLKPLIPQILAYVTVALLVVGCAALMILCASYWERSLWMRLAPLAAAAAITVLTLFFFSPNEVGLHAFYRSRLARAYLGASNLQSRRVIADQEKDDIRLSELHLEIQPQRRRPLHLVCCAANDLAGDHLANLHRGARSAVLSPVGYSVGEEWTEWKEGCHEPPTLASAITASGAAFNSHMGSKSMLWGPGVTFLMAALNLRLGLWLPHPRHWCDKTRASRLLAGLPFYKELLSASHAGTRGSSVVPGDTSPLAPCAQGKDVHLSDGGHFENMGLYELIRRHCRYIVVSDCGADPDVAFDDLGNAVRLVREDFGVEIDIDLRPLRPGADGLAVQPMVAGDIRYPTGDTGVLLLFKPTLVGNEPADILQYKRRNGAFPHETTGDQFYDEAQWESYRRLGFHASRSAFQFLQGERRRGADVFAQARFEWLPIPAAARESFPKLAARVSDLEKQLRDERCTRLLREVYKEIDELDRQGKIQAEAGTSGNAGMDPKAASSAEKAAGLKSDELAASLQVLRLAILFMEEVFFQADLETHADHRVNLGWLNYFARWAYAPLFRMWWPLLKSMYHARFTRFLEARFDLPHLQNSTPGVEVVSGWAEPVDRKDGGFAWECWERHSANVRNYGERKKEGKTFYQYRLKMSYEGRKEPYDIQAALVLLRKSDSRVAAWDVADFFVPPGLWGIGIGEDFLTKLPGALDVSTLVARLARTSDEPLEPRVGTGDGDCAPQPRGKGADPVRRRERATDSQLYRSAGFREAWYDDALGTLVDPVSGDTLLKEEDLEALFGSLDRAEAKKRSWLFLPPNTGELPRPGLSPQ